MKGVGKSSKGLSVHQKEEKNTNSYKAGNITLFLLKVIISHLKITFCQLIQLIKSFQFSISIDPRSVNTNLILKKLIFKYFQIFYVFVTNCMTKIAVMQFQKVSFEHAFCKLPPRS